MGTLNQVPDTVSIVRLELRPKCEHGTKARGCPAPIA
jgi:hypothetical protein